jgi:hypothetical protein
MTKGGSQSFYPIPNPVFVDDYICVTLKIPKYNDYMTQLIGMLTHASYWFNYDRDIFKSGALVANVWQEVIATMEIGVCGASVGAGGDGIGIGEAGSGEFRDPYDELIRLLMETQMKFRLGDKIYSPVIDLIEDCGCSGVAADEGATGIATVPGSTSGGAWSDYTTLCDVSTTVVPQILDLVDDFMGLVASGALIGDLIGLDGSLGDIFPSLLTSVRQSVGDITQTLTDPDFIRLAKVKAVRTWGDPIETLSRDDLRRYARSMPLVFEGAPMWAAFVIWAERANLNQVNVFISDAAGTGAYAGECDSIFAEVGRPIFNPVNIPNLPVNSVVDVAGYRLTKIISGVSYTSVAGYNSAAFTPVEDWVGVLIQWQATGANPTNFSITINIRDAANLILGFTSAAGRQVEAANADIFSDFVSIVNPVTIRGEINAGTAPPPAFVDQGKSSNVTLNDGSPIANPIAGAEYTFDISSNAGGVLIEVWQVTLAPV